MSGRQSPNNFKETLPKAQSDLAEQILKDPYNFGFLTLETAYREKELEQGLIDHIQKLLLQRSSMTFVVFSALCPSENVGSLHIIFFLDIIDK